MQLAEAKTESRKPVTTRMAQSQPDKQTAFQTLDFESFYRSRMEIEPLNGKAVSKIEAVAACSARCSFSSVKLLEAGLWKFEEPGIDSQKI